MTSADLICETKIVEEEKRPVDGKNCKGNVRPRKDISDCQNIAKEEEEEMPVEHLGKISTSLKSLPHAVRSETVGKSVHDIGEQIRHVRMISHITSH